MDLLGYERRSGQLFIIIATPMPKASTWTDLSEKSANTMASLMAYIGNAQIHPVFHIVLGIALLLSAIYMGYERRQRATPGREAPVIHVAGSEPLPPKAASSSPRVLENEQCIFKYAAAILEDEQRAGRTSVKVDNIKRWVDEVNDHKRTSRRQFAGVM